MGYIDSPDGVPAGAGRGILFLRAGQSDPDTSRGVGRESRVEGGIVTGIDAWSEMGFIASTRLIEKARRTRVDRLRFHVKRRVARSLEARQGAVIGLATREGPDDAPGRYFAAWDGLIASRRMRLTTGLFYRSADDGKLPFIAGRYGFEGHESKNHQRPSLIGEAVWDGPRGRLERSSIGITTGDSPAFFLTLTKIADRAHDRVDAGLSLFF